MPNQNPSAERAPLLGGHDGSVEVNGTDPPSKSQRAHDWLSRNVLTIILAILLVFFIALFLVVFLVPLPIQDLIPGGDEASVCTAAGCVLASSTLLRSISPRHKDLDPCDDFRTFACEGFDAIHEIREDQTSVGSLQIMSEEGQLTLKRVLESPAPKHVSLFWTASSPDDEIFTKMQNSYNACLNETQLRAVGSKPLIDLLVQLGDIYPEKKPKGKDTSLTEAIQFMMTIGSRGPISLGVGADDKDPDENVISLSPPWSFGLPSKQYYQRKEILDLYKETIGQVLEALMKEAEPSHMLVSTFQAPGSVGAVNEQLVESLIYFEAQLATASPDPEDLQDITKVYNPRSLEEADAYNPEISVKTLVNHFAPKGFKPSKVIVASPEYLKDLANILAKVDRETLRAYLVWKVVQSYGGVVESDSLEPLRRFSNKLQGKGPDVKPERWRTCVDVVDSDLPWILSRFFIERAFSKEAKDLGDQIIYDIKSEFIVKLQQSEWMTKAVRKLAIEKVNLIRQKIGYPTRSPDVTNAKELQQYYLNVTVHADTFFKNRLSSTKNDIRRMWAQLGQPVDKDEWEMSAPTVNAYYSPAAGEITFPAGIMQSPVFYDPSVPKYLSYGAFGAVAGHELSHAFDSLGRHYDQNGNYTDWWDKSTVEEFTKKADCFVEQYHNYTIPTKDGQIPINGKLTLGENIADAGGLTAAFQAWKQRDSENPDKLLPGLQEFSKEQVFFLAYGLTWCGKTREEEAIRRVYTDPHSPAAFRIKGTTSNSREFREAFNCPVKEPTCELW